MLICWPIIACFGWAPIYFIKLERRYGILNHQGSGCTKGRRFFDKNTKNP
jgi:hypothetical protein